MRTLKILKSEFPNVVDRETGNSFSDFDMDVEDDGEHYILKSDERNFDLMKVFMPSTRPFVDRIE